MYFVFQLGRRVDGLTVIFDMDNVTTKMMWRPGKYKSLSLTFHKRKSADFASVTFNPSPVAKMSSAQNCRLLHIRVQFA